jgi:hypothetical protein
MFNKIDSSHPETKINSFNRPDTTKLSPTKELDITPNQFLLAPEDCDSKQDTLTDNLTIGERAHLK